jgi:membrane-associated protease RseP (regulator of RpoE activity)
MNTFLQASLSLAVALALAGHAAPAQAQAATAPRAAAAAAAGNEKALADARAELARAARRVAELSREQAEVVRVEHGFGSRPVLGVLLAADDGGGVRVAGVTPDSGAAKAGLKPGDRITSIDGRQVLGSTGELRVENLRRLLDGLEAGRQVRVGYQRDGRAASAAVTPSEGRRMFVFAPDGADGNAMFGRDGFDFYFDFDELPAVAPEIRREIIRIGPDGACKDGACKAPALMSAFRWSGLNLAEVDPQLGRYFGADRGVLVLSSGDLAGLQAGDVIQRIDGKPVASPREAMAALRGKDAGAKVPVDYLRDRKAGHAQVTVPKLMPLPLPPAPPAPPAPPPAAPKPPPAPPAPSTPRAADTGADLPAPPAPPAPPMPPVADIALVSL